MIAVGAVVLALWLGLLLGRGLFWLARERDDRDESIDAPTNWPAVVAVVPARNEADVLARSLGSLLDQDYPGEFRITLVDDNSSDDTAHVARTFDGGVRLEVISGASLPAGWTGKLWALSQGIERAGQDARAPDYLWLTDADIAHVSDNLRRLVARAEAGKLILVSLMARLSVKTWAERAMIPAFVFFFAMLYPFAWVNDPRRRAAAAAGGCMLVRRDALEAAGGIAAIKGEIIDDCALAALLKKRGPIWLGLTDRAHSLRPYESLAEIGRMISRSAYAQLRFSPWLLALTILGMGLIYLAPPLLAFLATGAARWLAGVAWLAMALAFQPMLRFYRRSPAWGFALPLIATLYAAFTVQSAAQAWAGRGGMWKGRPQALGVAP